MAPIKVVVCCFVNRGGGRRVQNRGGNALAELVRATIPRQRAGENQPLACRRRRREICSRMPKPTQNPRPKIVAMMSKANMSNPKHISCHETVWLQKKMEREDSIKTPPCGAIGIVALGFCRDGKLCTGHSWSRRPKRSTSISTLTCAFGCLLERPNCFYRRLIGIIK
jgi:hypothetical protein